MKYATQHSSTLYALHQFPYDLFVRLSLVSMTGDINIDFVGAIWDETTVRLLRPHPAGPRVGSFQSCPCQAQGAWTRVMLRHLLRPGLEFVDAEISIMKVLSARTGDSISHVLRCPSTSRWSSVTPSSMKAVIPRSLNPG